MVCLSLGVSPVFKSPFLLGSWLLHFSSLLLRHLFFIRPPRLSVSESPPSCFSFTFFFHHLHLELCFGYFGQESPSCPPASLHCVLHLSLLIFDCCVHGRMIPCPALCCHIVNVIRPLAVSRSQHAANCDVCVFLQVLCVGAFSLRSSQPNRVDKALQLKLSQTISNHLHTGIAVRRYPSSRHCLPCTRVSMHI